MSLKAALASVAPQSTKQGEQHSLSWSEVVAAYRAIRTSNKCSEATWTKNWEPFLNEAVKVLSAKKAETGYELLKAVMRKWKDAPTMQISGARILQLFMEYAVARHGVSQSLLIIEVDKDEQEQVEIFWGNSVQVIVLGKHPSGVFYHWDETSPADLKPLPPEWLAFWLKLAGKQDDTSTAVVKHDRQTNDGAGWSYVDDCDMCGRNGRLKPDCRQNHNGELLRCKHGNSYSPPSGLKPNQIVQGATKKWRFQGTYTNDVGTFSRFVLEELPKMQQQSQG